MTEFEFSIESENLDANIEEFEKQVADRVADGMEVAASIISELMRANAPNAPLSLSISRENVTNTSAGVPDAIEHVIGVVDDETATEIAQDYEYGAPPHDVDVENVLAWVRSKGLPDTVAWAMIDLIRKQGIEARPFVFRTVEENKNIILREIENAVNGSQ